MKNAIPVYDICRLSDVPSVQKNQEFHIERFGNYVSRHPKSLHLSHGHSFYHMVLFTKGSGKHTIDFMQFNVKPGQLYCMIPGQVHSWNFTGDVDGFIINFSDNFFRSLLLRPDYLEQFIFFSGISNDGVIQLKNSVLERVNLLFEELLFQSELVKSNGNTDILRVILLHIFLLMDENTAKVHSNTVAGSRQMLMKNFRRLIEQHYKTMRLPKEYADLLYITPNHLNALCQEMVNTTAGELIRQRVLLEAKRLLINADLNISEIAYTLNFKDNSYFSRFFRKYEKISPEDFRARFVTTK